ncbi:MAG TPA: CarD family transcriptional regulator, partial [Anaerolineae bacterium]|nr:CarD family transcriptional regulator [Anaerolineae bacterium]
MQFKVGDVVVHPVYGVSTIVKITEKRLSEMEVHLSYEIALPRRTVWIPIKAQASVGLRLVTAKSDLDRYRDLLKSSPVPLNNAQPQRRHEELARRLKQGSFPVMCEIVRDLTAS